jgi:hypothetical protein
MRCCSDRRRAVSQIRKQDQPGLWHLRMLSRRVGSRRSASEVRSVPTVCGARLPRNTWYAPTNSIGNSGTVAIAEVIRDNAYTTSVDIQSASRILHSRTSNCHGCALYCHCTAGNDGCLNIVTNRFPMRAESHIGAARELKLSQVQLKPPSSVSQ